ncbi:MAG: hypothetical protein ACFE9S_04240 [Candidatus Hermodarchaeota archaeon]
MSNFLLKGILLIFAVCFSILSVSTATLCVGYPCPPNNAPKVSGVYAAIFILLLIFFILYKDDDLD